MSYPVEKHATGATDSSSVTFERQFLQSGNMQGRTLDTLEQSLNEIYIFDAQSLRFEYVNPVAQRNLGYSLAALQLMTPLDLKLGYNETSFRARLQRLLSGENELDIFEAWLSRADGTQYRRRVSSTVIYPPCRLPSISSNWSRYHELDMGPRLHCGSARNGFTPWSIAFHNSHGSQILMGHEPGTTSAGTITPALLGRKWKAGVGRNSMIPRCCRR